MHLAGGRLREFARGCDVLGGGGGGQARYALPLAAHAVELTGPVPVVQASELPSDGLVMPCSFLGAPAIGAERIGTCREAATIRGHVERHFGRPVVAMLCNEIGGFHGTASVALAAHAGLPMLDADGMGRAFPGMSRVSMHLAGVSPEPVVLADEHDRVVAVHADGDGWLERMARSVVVGFGDRGVSSEYVMTVEQAAGAVIDGSIAKALRIGELIGEAKSVADAARAIAAEFDGVVIAEGKVAAALPEPGRPTPATIEGTGPDHGRTLRLEVGHEYLAVVEDGQVLATVPDIITVFDTYTGEALGAGELRYGHRVVAVALPCPDVWRTPAGLDLVGPAAFGLDLPYRPVVAP
ncbi:DUF917 domain-containing protein [Kutzneria buriramensis]|uniref:DUF917 domain-containing protein n=1 Tax=Kutzneria buriramensis TaxID=1045776 RepID=A0A3E0HYY6_9PSEU|nr:DUF917 domain-containing protein [Kutzneria buriramensis]REH51684.1 hypothetical protein BCF44_103133 [Kutzneria buriramensis]